MKGKMYNTIVHTISFFRGSIPGVNNKKFKEIILKDPKPLEPNTKDVLGFPAGI